MIALLVVAAQLPVTTPEVRLETIEGRPWFTVHAQNASAERVLADLALTAGRELELHTSFDGALVTVDLTRRPLEQVVEYALGSIGLRAELRSDAIVVHSAETRDPAQVLELATQAWSTAVQRFPADREAPTARLAQGEIAELSGDLERARERYLSLVDDYPKAPEVAEATMRAGRICGRLGQWGEAGRLYRALANQESATDYQAPARLEWARAMVAQGESEAALHMLTVLDGSYPATSPTEVTARRLVRARALDARGMHLEALRELDLADADLDRLGRREALEIRARALGGAGLPAEAARAWLLYGQDAQGGDRVFAYQQAAELALDAGEELAALFVVREASAHGVEVDLAHVEHAAFERLGLSADDEPKNLAERLARADAALSQGTPERAAELWEPLFLARGALDEATRARVAVGWARCVAGSAGLDPAIALLDEERAGLETLDARRVLDLGAAALFEAQGRFDDAADAYEGRYRR